MKILLINPPIRLDAPPSCIPYGLATIASVLQNDGHEVAIFDINGLRNSQNEVEQALCFYYEDWDVVGVSGLITTYSYQKWLIPLLREINPTATIIVGGGLATSSPELVEGVDLVITGEGEQAMHDICGGNKTFNDIDSLPFPAWDLLPIGIYLKNPIWGEGAGNSSGFKNVRVERSMNVVTSRGCPFSCNFCYHIFGRSFYKQRSVNSVIAEVSALIHKYNVDFIGFVDDNMLNSEQWILDFCSAMVHKNIAWGCHGRVNNATPRVLGAMAEAGCIWIGFGIESGSQKMLDLMNKKSTVGAAIKAIINTRKAGIFPNTTFIHGYPGETKETIQETVDFKEELELNCGSFFATPYPGTVLYKQVKHLLPEGYIEMLGNATDFVVNLTELSDEELIELRH